MNDNDNNINISIDTSPYIPDISVNNNIYYSSDNLNLSSSITTYETIFIFNLQYDENKSYNTYNDVNYMLYGITNGGTYFLPSLLYFKNIKITPYKILDQQLTINPNIEDLLKKIGYDMNDIILPDTGNNLSTDYVYKLLDVSDITERTSNIIFLFFYIKNQNNINYNKYNSTIFYNKIYNNVLIYPYVSNFETEFNYNIDDKPNENKNSEKYINSLYFNDRDLCSYINKLDYKYMENDSYSKNNIINLKKIKNYSTNLKCYEEYLYYQINKYKNNIFISLNEITKLNYKTEENIKINDIYQSQKKSYTDQIVLNKHINNNNTFSNVNQKNSLTLDNKLSFVKNNIKEKYSPYILNYINNNNLYPICKNYFITTYVGIHNPNLIITNFYLYKICVLINPKIIYDNYLLLNTTFKIEDLIDKQNILFFGVGIKKNEIN